MIAVGGDKTDEPVRGFPTHNRGLREAVAWDIQFEAARIYGTDLTSIPGVTT